jgi:hypothetical protein
MSLTFTNPPDSVPLPVLTLGSSIRLTAQLAFMIYLYLVETENRLAILHRN